MSRNIKFSTYIQCADGSHRKQSHKPTHFVEQILNSFNFDYRQDSYLDKLAWWNDTALLSGRLTYQEIFDFWKSLDKDITDKKVHTIRAQKNPLKAGDKFTPAIWTGLPYRSPQLIFLGEIEVKKTFDITFVPDDNFITINEANFNLYGYSEIIGKLAKNDGLSKEDFYNWFDKKGTSGTIIFWDENLSYI